MRFLIALFALIFSAAAPAAFAQEKQQAVFAGGCFWCMESDMQHLPGVISVESGYTGGKEKNPTYREVAMHRTGHYESVRVTFDPKKITYEQLLSRYWPLVDPTDAYGQFCDRGQSYAPAIFVTPEQKAAAEASKAKIAASGRVDGKVIVPILPLGDFWPAERYHRNYAKRNKENYDAYRQSCGRDRILAEVWKRVG
ncbi:MAG: peptide-methionine (S)-S-oxide reductase MsrA [Hyphomonadaceae bacterium]|nr:peptide-methionine (S)-S-oxide reductase MsrA [Hyphomonadaceae bacterium]